MKELKITVEQLKNYLGTGLNIQEPDWGKCKLDGLDSSSVYLDITSENFPIAEIRMGSIDDIKLVCYRLSDLDKFIPELGFVPLKELFPQWKWDEETESEQWFVDEDLKMKSAAYQLLKGPTLTFDRVQKLFQWHFWPFGEEYFEAGLVIDKLKQ